MKAPVINGNLRDHALRVPEAMWECSGIEIFGKKIRTLVFTTDISIVCNVNADAVLAVYAFTPQPKIASAILSAADKPVFCGVGGGTTRGKRVVNIARNAEMIGALGVVVNAPTDNEVITEISKQIDIPVIATVVSESEDIDARVKAGVDIFNVSAAAKTAEVVRKIRASYPEFPIIATGGPTEETIKEVIEAGANAVTWTPPTTGELMHELMVKYRAERGNDSDKK